MSEAELDQVESQAGQYQSQSRFRRVIAWILRMALAALFGVGLGVAVYLGAPALLRALTEPVVQNRADIDLIRAELARNQDDEVRRVQQLRDQVNRLGSDLSAVEVTAAAQQSSLDEMQGQLEAQAARLDDVEQLANQLEQLQMGLDEVQAELDQVATSDPELEAAIRELRQMITILRTMELIARARSELLQDNLGLAQENLEAASASLTGLITGAQAADETRIQSALDRLQLAQDALPGEAALAADDLEAAWRSLLDLSDSGEVVP